MQTKDISAGPEGFEHRTFECTKCGHLDDQVTVADPLQSDAVGWLSGELGQRPVNLIERGHDRND
jgi:hypothetical protein